jgi:hypothetical protein
VKNKSGCIRMSDFTRISEIGQSSRTQEQPSFDAKLNEPQSKNVTMPNYSDLLSSMKSEMNQPKISIPPPAQQPQVEQMNQQLLQNQHILGENMQQEFYKQNQQLHELLEAKKETINPIIPTEFNEEMDLKFEALFLACICALVQMPNLQNFIFSKIPSMYDNSKLTIIGVLINSIIISTTFIVVRKLAVKYTKEC